MSDGNRATCPFCGGNMKETSAWWFTCSKCGKGCDGEEVEWENDKPEWGVKITVCTCPICNKTAGLNQKEMLLLCDSCGILKLVTCSICGKGAFFNEEKNEYYCKHCDKA